jgi:hypothetical protein
MRAIVCPPRERRIPFSTTHKETPMLNTDLITDSQALLDAKASQGHATRRTALKAALGVGYAASVLPVMAQTAIKTPADGLTAGEVMIDVNGFKMPAYRAAPAGKTGLPVVLVLSEIFGVHEYIADTARRFAKAGYLAIAPELFVRQGDAQSYGEMAKLIAEVISKVPDAQVMADLDATVKWAAANGGDVKKLGVAVCGAQPGGEGWRGLVRPAGRPDQRSQPQAPGGRGRRPARSGARALRRGRHRHPA